TARAAALAPRAPCRTRPRVPPPLPGAIQAVHAAPRPDATTWPCRLCLAQSGPSTRPPLLAPSPASTTPLSFISLYLSLSLSAVSLSLLFLSPLHSSLSLSSFSLFFLSLLYL